MRIDGFLRNHSYKLSGIVNGLDIEQWDPQTDAAINTNFSAHDSSGKAACKQALQQQCGLTVSADIPLLTLISRLADQKGIDLIVANAAAWIARGYQIVILGSGDPDTEQSLHALADRNPSSLYFWRGFNETLARQIYAGGDIFLMPSRFEPCGLGQLMAMRYGTVPVVRATGGLKDTVVNYRSDPEHATGFHFTDAIPEAFDLALEAAVTAYRQPEQWSAISTRAMRRDSSWEASAADYTNLYLRLLNR